MVCVIKNKGIIKNYSDTIKNFIYLKCTVPNPIYLKKSQMGLSLWGINPYLIYYQEINNQLIVPIGILPELFNNFDNFYIVDERFEKENKEFFSTLNFTVTLRDYQEEIVNICMSRTIGTIEAMTGSGKTIAFIYFILKRQQNCLILVNTLELANQIKNSLLKVTTIKEEDIGFIGSGKFNIKPITIALLQTMNKLEDNKYNIINNYFGLVISDEVHIIAAKTYYNVMNRLDAKYKFGFSATPEREDGLTDVIKFATGPIIYKVPEEKLNNVIIKPSLIKIETDYYFPLFDTSEYTQMLNDLSENDERNNLIYKTWKENYTNNFTIMLCSRLSQIYKLKNLIGDEALILTSKLKKQDREKIMQELINKNKKVIISTYGLFSTGIDLPHFDVLFLCAPIKSKIKVKQSAGRLMRQSDNKSKAIIVDFVDKKIPILKNHFYRRKRILENL